MGQSTDPRGARGDPRSPERRESELEALRGIFGLAMHLNERMYAALGHKRDQFDIYALSTLARRGPMKQSELAIGIGKSSVFVTRMVDHLEKDGLVERGQHQFDRRINVIRLTSEGKQAYERMKASAEALARDLFIQTPDERLDLLIANMRRMSTRMGFSLNAGPWPDEPQIPS